VGWIRQLKRGNPIYNPTHLFSSLPSGKLQDREDSCGPKMAFFKRKKESEPQFYATVADGLKKIYRSKLLPLEEAYDFHEFVSPQLQEPDFDAKPMVLLVGQYSTGKTTFIRYLLERDYPGIRIGPEPTTDSFTAVMYGENEQVIGNNTNLTRLF
jgi:hypothetical protein